MGKSAGVKPAKFDRCELKDGIPTGSEYGSTPSHASIEPGQKSATYSGNVTDPQTRRPKPVSSS